MNDDLKRIHCRRLRILSTACAVIVAIGLSGSTCVFAATLTGTTYDLRLLGHVKNAAGTVFSTEGYEASPVFDVFSTNLPNTIVPSPIPPLVAGNTLRVDESEAAGTAIIWIRGPLSNPNDTFANMLDPAFDVELDLTFRFNGLGVGEKIVISNVKPENGAHGFYTPVSVQTSGTGSVADPLRLSLRLDPSDIQGNFSTSHVKLHFDFDEMDILIPEPASCMLLMVGLAGLTAFARGARQ
jgi:hypothetical protein